MTIPPNEKTVTISESIIDDMWKQQLAYIKEQMAEIEALLKADKEKEQ